MSKSSTRLLVFSDLDGSLLDHHSYSFDNALPVVRMLQKLEIPLVLVSSKTCAEIRVLRKELANEHPFVVENGAAVFIPRGYFPKQPPGTRTEDGHWVYDMVPGRERWLAELAALRREFPGQFETFHDAGVEGIVAMTGLSRTGAAAANARGYSEPVKWLGSTHTEDAFIERLRDRGASVARGGRFLAVSGECDKGQALTWVRKLYTEAHPGADIADLAIGDSDNDRAMLEAARSALVIKSPVHEYPALRREKGVLYSNAHGPAGWAEGVSRWLLSYGISI